MPDPRDDAPGEPDRDRGSDRDRERDRDRDLRQRVEDLVPEIVKRTFAAGLGAVFSTEEGIRKMAKDINIPDVAGYLASTADTTKDKVVEIVAREVREFLQTMNFGEEIAKLLTTLSFEIKTEIRFIPNSEKYTGVEPDVKASAKLKRAGTVNGDRDKGGGDKDKGGGDKAGGDKGGADKDRAADDGTERKPRRFWRRDDEADADEPGDGDDR